MRRNEGWDICERVRSNIHEFMAENHPVFVGPSFSIFSDESRIFFYAYSLMRKIRIRRYLFALDHTTVQRDDGRLLFEYERMYFFHAMSA